VLPLASIVYPIWGKDCWMSRIVIAIVASFAVASLSACGTMGKGKGKAPPPVAEPAPVAEPVIK
jgi:hypothetical protein